MCTCFFFKIGINRDGLDPSCSNLLQRDKTMYTHNYYLVTNVVNIYLDNVYIMYVHLFGFFFKIDIFQATDSYTSHYTTWLVILKKLFQENPSIFNVHRDLY
jgi:hypothetical protein